MENQQPPPPAPEGECQVPTNLDLNSPKNSDQLSSLINTFCEITSASQSEALFYLESHNYSLDSAVSTFLETATTATTNGPPLTASANLQPQLSPSQSESYSPSETQSQSSSPSRSRSPSPPRQSRRKQYNLRSKKSSRGARTSGIRTLADLNRQPGNGAGSDSESDEPQEYYTGGEKSGMLVQDPSRANDGDAIFNQARLSGAVERPAEHLRPSSSSRSFTGTARLLSGETLSPAPRQPEVVTHNIIFWSDGFTIDDGPLRRLDDPENASFLESIRMSECPEELQPADKRTAVHVTLIKKEENYPMQVSEKTHFPFKGVGRTLGSTSSSTSTEPTAAATAFATAPAPSTGLVVDQALPSTSIQLRLADGTRMISRFNCHHTIRDIRGFIDASRPGGSRTYQLQTVGFPPKQLNDLDQTIEQAGLSNSVVIQKL